MNIQSLNDNNIKQYLKVTDFENAFSVYIDDMNNYVFNLNSNIYINVEPTSLETFTCDYDMFWTLISYKIYGTTRLAWLLMKLNDVDAKHMFDIKHASEQIKYLPKEQMQSIVASINEFDD